MGCCFLRGGGGGGFGGGPQAGPPQAGTGGGAAGLWRSQNGLRPDWRRGCGLQKTESRGLQDLAFFEGTCPFWAKIYGFMMRVAETSTYVKVLQLCGFLFVCGGFARIFVGCVAGDCVRWVRRTG